MISPIHRWEERGRERQLLVSSPSDRVHFRTHVGGEPLLTSGSWVLGEMLLEDPGATPGTRCNGQDGGRPESVKRKLSDSLGVVSSGETGATQGYLKVN